LGDGLFRLRNVPFLVYGFRVEDIVSAVPKDGFLIVKAAANHRGHSTYRVFLPEGQEGRDFSEEFRPLAQLGCTYERANARLIGIDVPPVADIHAVYAALEEGERNRYWKFEEGHCGHQVR
jgi:hypothetical protein